jgi:hypothetical protein
MIEEIERALGALDRFLGDVEVDLRAAEAPMPDESADCLEVGAGFEEMRGKRMAHRVGRDGLLDPGPRRVETYRFL